MNLEGKVALITGGTRGIGRATAEVLKKLGAKVYITGTSDNVFTVANQIGAVGFKLDVRDRDKVKQVVSEIAGKEANIDILVNNAGITKDSLFIRMKDEAWDEVIAVNLTGVYNVTRQVAPIMMKKKKGSIINVSSVVGFMGNAGQVNYSSTKAALLGFTKSLAKELAPRNVRVNCVAPGFITTDMTAKIPQKIKESLLKSIPMGREGSAEEVANVIAFLASDLASYITGTVIHVNGGLF